MSRGNLYVISGPSGVGKSTVVRTIMEQDDHIRFSVSMTTRAKRPAEVHGESYFFVTHQAFEQAIANGELLEYTEYVGNYYGTPEPAIDAMLEQGIDVLMDIEPVGALNVQKKRPDAVLIFMAAPSFSDIESRLYGRGDTPEDKIKSRLERARWEYQQAVHYDYIVVNDSIAVASGEIQAIMLAEKCKTNQRTGYLKEDI